MSSAGDVGGWPVSVDRMGRSIFDPIWAEREHVDARSELIHVLRGRVRIETRDYTVAGQPGDTLYTPAGTPHKDVFPRGSVFEVYLVQFRWTQEQAMLERLHPMELAEASRRSRSLFGRAFDQLYREFVTDLEFNQPLVSIRAGQIIYELCRGAAMRKRAAADSREQISRQRREQIMEEVTGRIHATMHEPISLDALAEAVGVSPYYLSRVFSQESGFTLSSYITQVRMEAAERLLAETRLSVKEVAGRVGFRDSPYFSRVFRGWFHVSPTSYRRQLGK